MISYQKSYNFINTLVVVLDLNLIKIVGFMGIISEGWGRV